MKLDWNRGLLRAWVVTAAFWLGGFAVAQRDALFPNDHLTSCSMLDERPDLLFPRGPKGECLVATKAEQLLAFGWLIGFPVGLFIFGAAVRWAVVGFKRQG
jgi:hypothetical protein